MPLDPNSPTVVEGIDDDPIHKEVKFFGRDLNKVACFKESFVYSILGAVGAGLLTFTATSRVMSATNVSVFSFTGIGIVYWINCRHNWANSKFTIAQTQRALIEKDRRMAASEQLGDNQTNER